jgi:hypothetical protein
MSRLRRSKTVAAIIGIYLILGLGWVVLIPPFEKPDEIHHLAFIQLVAQQGEWPNLLHPQTPLVVWEAQQPPLYYVGGVVVYQLAKAMGVPTTDLNVWLKRINPNFFWKKSTPPRDNNFFQQAGTFFAPDKTYPYDLMILRLVTLALGAVTVFFAYQTALLAFRGAGHLALLTTSLVAFLPQYTFITTTVSNDNLAITFGAIVLYLLARLRFASERTLRRDGVLLGLLLGCGVLSKLTTLSLVPLVVLAVWQVKATFRLRLQYLLWIALAFGLLTGGWFIRTMAMYGDPLGRHYIVNPAAFTGEIDPKPLFSTYFGSYFWGTLGQSLVGKFGFMHIDMPIWYYRLWLIASMASFAGLVALAVRLARKTSRLMPWLDVGVWVLMVCAVILAIAELIQYNLMISQPQGRFLSHVFPAIAIVFVSGLLSGYFLLKQFALKRWPHLANARYRPTSKASSLIVSASLVGVNLLTLFYVLLPAYSTNVL